MNDYTNFRFALNEIVRILSPHSRPDAKRAMASKLATAARGEVIENLSFRYSDIGHIFFPDNEHAALVLTEQISTARQSGELASIIPIGDGLLPTDLITWPACPLVSAKNPLSYWLPVTTAPSGAPESDKPLAFRPRIGWQIAMFDAWPAMKKLYGRDPTPAEAIKYLKQHDTSGDILPKGAATELWWRPRRGEGREVAFSTVENTISEWRTKGVLPA